MKLYHAAYLAIFLHFGRLMARNFISDGVERSLWFNLEVERISLRIHTSSNSVLLNAIKNRMIEHTFRAKLISIGKPKFGRTMELADTHAALPYFSKYAGEIREILAEFGIR